VGDSPDTEHHDDWTKKLSGFNELSMAANMLLEALRPLTPEKRKYRLIQIATFAAYEAKRELKVRHNPIMIWFYISFLVVTAYSSVYVATVNPAAKGIVWDAFGVGSTMVLLYLTYGLYTLRMFWKWLRGLGDVLSTPPNDPGPDDTLTPSQTEPGDAGDNTETFTAVFFLIVGTILSYNAITTLYRLYDIAIGPDDPVAYARVYAGYFLWIFFLSLLFILMDLSVAAFNQSHAETYVGASSAAHATIPMAIGIGLVGAYLLAEYVYASLWLADPRPWKALSVEFASGALTFQMIISNVLFILIKNNVVFRLFYNTIGSTRGS